MGVEVDGMGDVLSDLDELKDDFSGPNEDWVVGTPVEYSQYLEYGTTAHRVEPTDADALQFEINGDIAYSSGHEVSGIDPTPFFRPAVNEVRLQGPMGFIRHNSRKEPEDIESTREFLQTLSLALEGRIKEIITRKGLIDTGNLRASVQAVPITDIRELEQ